jgi:uncharacterized protein YfaA (DUF2138 family)
MAPLFRDLWQREYFHLANKEDHTKAKGCIRSLAEPHTLPRTNRVMNSVFIVPAELVLLQWV